MRTILCGPVMLWIAGCGPVLVSEPCACEVQGHGTRSCEVGGECGACMCLPALPPTEHAPETAQTFFVDPDVASSDGDGSAGAPWRGLKWGAIDNALAEGDVIVFFSARLAAADRNQTTAQELQILRTDTSDHHLILDGRSQANLDDSAPRWVPHEGLARAQWRGVTTTEAHVKRSHITLRGFELRDSVNQGVFWEAGDDVLLEDLVITSNGRSPAIIFEYANISGLPSSGITIRNSHIFNTTGECVYVGGREGEAGQSHQDVLIENNLIHDCGVREKNGDDWDGINLKDGLVNAVVWRNVIFHAHWGIQVTSTNPLLEQNLIFNTDAAGIMIGGGGWGVPLDGTTLVTDNAILRAGGDGSSGTSAGIYVDADTERARGAVFTHNTIADIGSGPAMMLAGNGGLSIELSNSWLTHANVGLDGWGDVSLSGSGNAFFRNQKDVDRSADTAATRDIVERDPRYRDLQDVAGDDHVYFTDDDGWIARAEGSRGARLTR